MCECAESGNSFAACIAGGFASALAGTHRRRYECNKMHICAKFALVRSLLPVIAQARDRPDLSIRYANRAVFKPNRAFIIRGNGYDPGTRTRMIRYLWTPFSARSARSWDALWPHARSVLDAI
jgi:hypothetical protein